MKRVTVFTLTVCSLLITVQAAHSADQIIKGAGSTAAAPIYQSWSAEYLKSGHPSLEYESIGSSAGLKKIREQTTDFGASDVAPSPQDLAKNGQVVFPIAITGIAPILNVPTIADGQLRLDGDLLARIFLGEITIWKDPAIKLLNPDLKLPDLPIKVVVRSDGSGTTYNFTDYLSKISLAWSGRYGAITSMAWPQTYIGAKGSDGVVKAVKTTIGAIGYVDFGYVKANALKSVQLKNASGNFVAPSNTGFKAALVNSDWNSKGSFNKTLSNQDGSTSWPITMGTFVVFPQVTTRPLQTSRALAFIVWAFMNGDRLVQQNNFVRLPDQVQALAFKIMSSIRSQSGAPLELGLGTGTGVR